jgi:glycosidase
LACADLDGFRLDAVKHMEVEAVTFFVKEIQTFAKKLGKENFYLTGEVAGGRARALEMMRATGLNAIVAVDDVPGTLEAVVKGRANPAQYFEYFLNERDLTSWNNTNVVTMYDDHDQIRNGFAKARFAAGDERWQLLELNALALLVTTVGIPCVYYGSEQAFDGSGGDDNYIRECMFGGPFGPFRSRNGHTFNEKSEMYKQLSRLLTLRKTSQALRRGTQQLLQISGDGEHYGLPEAIGGTLIGVIPWLRQIDEEVMLCAMNTDVENQQTVGVLLPKQYADRKWRCVYSSDSLLENSVLVSSTLSVPKHGFVVYKLV